MNKKCEACGACAGGSKLLDYCAEYCADLCDQCMQVGCCGRIPAASGTATDAFIAEEVFDERGILR